MEIDGVDVKYIAVSHAGNGELARFAVPDIAFALTWSDDRGEWDVAGEMTDGARADIGAWAKREVGQLMMNGEHGACPTSWSA